MKPFSKNDDSYNTLPVNEVTHDVNSDHTDAQCRQTDSYASTPCEVCSNSLPMPKTSVLMLSNIQIHRQVPLNGAKISKETKSVLYKLLQKYDTIASKSDNDIGQTDLIEMQIATRPDAAAVTAWPYPLALKHHDSVNKK